MRRVERVPDDSGEAQAFERTRTDLTGANWEAGVLVRWRLAAAERSELLLVAGPGMSRYWIVNEDDEDAWEYRVTHARATAGVGIVHWVHPGISLTADLQTGGWITWDVESAYVPLDDDASGDRRVNGTQSWAGVNPAAMLSLHLWFPG
ncbi:MAG: hypothetical protein GY913_23340 [Proteobacteria bacterium]|nr:hypothetical protein [Pseudomonadota bacterium]MCP4919847.1 hypothetical protein [Pseudomonadota bacterium]